MTGCEPSQASVAVDPLSALVFTEHQGIVHRQRMLLHRVFAKQHLHPAQAMCMRVLAPVSYTHLTLPTILLV